jgi:hypothetical protein
MPQQRDPRVLFATYTPRPGYTPQPATAEQGQPALSAGQVYPPGYGYQTAAGTGFGERPGDAVSWLLPVGRTWQSIVAGYVGLVTLVFWPLGPVSIGLGVWSLIRLNRSGARGHGRAAFAIAAGLLGTAMTVWVLTLALAS